MTPEKKLIYQIFHLLWTHEIDPERTNFTKTYISSIRDKISVELRRDVLKRSMKGAPTTSANDILTTLSLVYQESIDKESQVSTKEELDKADLDKAQVTRDHTDSGNTHSSAIEKTTKKKMHELIGQDLWQLGKI